MAAASCSPPTFSASFESRSDPHFSAATNPINRNPKSSSSLSSYSLRLSPSLTFLRHLRTTPRRNCSNIGVPQIVASSSSSSNHVDASTPIPPDDNDNDNDIDRVMSESDASASHASFPSTTGTLAVHAGERLGRGIVTDAITTSIVDTSTYMFKNTAELIAFKEGSHHSFEYDRYGNPTTKVAEEKISALEGAESTLLVASGMYATHGTLKALRPHGGDHIVINSDCYRKTRDLIKTMCKETGISVTVIDPADMGALKSALDKHNVYLFFTESPTNPYLRCIDIELVSKLCHSKGAKVCIDGTFASPVNQKALALGADIVLQSATKYIGGHNDVITGCISGSEELVSKVRFLHHIYGGVLNPVTGDLMTARKFVDALKIPYIAASFGSCESLVDPPAIMSYWDPSPDEKAELGIKDNLIRFSFRVEDFEDLKSGIKALEVI